MLTGERREGPLAVVVLGYGNADPVRPNAVNRRRLRAALATIACTPRGPDQSEPVLILSGGAVRGPVPEAEIMARHLRERLGYSGPLLTETASRSTLENMRRVAPMLAPFDRVAIVSQPLHALLARAHLLREHPELAPRLIRARDARWRDAIGLRPVELWIGLPPLRRARVRELDHRLRTSGGFSPAPATGDPGGRGADAFLG